MLPRLPVLQGNPSSSSSLLCESAICNSISPLTDHPDVVDLRGRVNSKLGRPGGGDGNDCLVSMDMDVAGAELGVVGVSGREPVLLKCGRMAV
jgi:hypothetical protein